MGSGQRARTGVVRDASARGRRGRVPGDWGDDDENAEQVAMEEDGPVSSTVWLVLGGGVLLLGGVITGLWALTRRSQRDSR